jgi:hypothetical protein
MKEARERERDEMIEGREEGRKREREKGRERERERERGEMIVC